MLSTIGDIEAKERNLVFVEHIFGFPEVDVPDSGAQGDVVQRFRVLLDEVVPVLLFVVLAQADMVSTSLHITKAERNLTL